VKIGPVDTEMALLIVKKEEITEGKIYSSVGKFSERAKLYMLSFSVYINSFTYILLAT